jgi:DNA (cytosine-5)-methyltransferase 1
MLDFYEFFAGGGMVRAGLGPSWRCLFANDFDEKKSRSYRENWGSAELKTADVASLATSDIPGRADLAWGSFPCQDLSLAGAGAGLKGGRSGSFWPFWNLMRGLVEEARAPQTIVMENVCGLLTSHDGKDFAAICTVLGQAGYRAGALVADAELFVPQSRPRLFIIGVRREAAIPERLVAEEPQVPWHSRALQAAYFKLPQMAKDEWIWWRLPLPQRRVIRFCDVIEQDFESASWFSLEETQRLLSLMSERNRAKVAMAQRMKGRVVGGVYRRTRRDLDDCRVQRAEIRFDDVSGCLRTPAGGSSRQTILVVDGQRVRARLITGRETARLMGLPDEYKLPENYTEAYHLTGDGVAVPVVRHLAEFILEPILDVLSGARTPSEALCGA